MTDDATPRWELPQFIPRDTARARDMRWVRIVPNPAVPVPAVIATPLVATEVAPWVKPAASVCFPLHPLGALALYDRARRLLAVSGLVTALAPEQLAYTEVCLWRFASKLFKPGESIRGRLDAAAENRDFQIREDDHRDPFTAQPAHLAAWLVVRASVEWAKEAGS